MFAIAFILNIIIIFVQPLTDYQKYYINPILKLR